MPSKWEEHLRSINLERRMHRLKLDSAYYLKHLGGVDFLCPGDAHLISCANWVHFVAKDFNPFLLYVHPTYYDEACAAVRTWDLIVNDIILLSWKVRCFTAPGEKSKRESEATLARLCTNVEKAVERYRRGLIRRRRSKVPTYMEETVESYLVEKFRHTFTSKVSKAAGRNLQVRVSANAGADASESPVSNRSGQLPDNGEVSVGSSPHESVHEL